MTKQKRVISIIMALLLVFGMFAVLPMKAEAASKKVTMYVVAEHPGRGGTEYYTYYSNGLLKKISNSPTDVGAATYTYDRNNRVKTENGGSGVIKYSYKNGRISKSSDINGTWKYTYNRSGQLIKKVRKNQYGTSTDKFKYDSKGRLTTFTNKQSNGKYTYIFNYKKIRYNSRGQIKSYTIERDGNIKLPCRHKYTYKNGRIVKDLCQNYVGGTWSQARMVITYKYKKIQVPASMVAKVKAQQHDILSPAPIGIAIVTAQA